MGRRHCLFKIRLLEGDKLRPISLFAWIFLVLLSTSAFGQQGFLPEGFAEAKVVVIDPGHGGYDEGTLTPTGEAEKTTTLQLAQRLKEALDGFCRVHLTRDGDYWVDLDRRTALANHHRADVFISLHASKGLHSFVDGVLVFRYVDPSGESFSLVEEEEMDDMGSSLAVWNEVQPAHTRQSQLLAACLHERFVEKGYAGTRGTLGAPLYILKGADMAAVVVELGRMDPPEKRNPTGRSSGTIESIARTIAQGLNDYFGKSASCVDTTDMIEEDIYPGRGAVW